MEKPANILGQDLTAETNGGQAQGSVESFGWQWTEREVLDSTRTFYRRLFKDAGIWFDHHDGKVIADVCSGNGRHVWALSKLTKATHIISVELSLAAAEYQRGYLSDPRIEVLQADAAAVEFKADFIYLLGAIQHTQAPQRTLNRMIANLSDRGELLVSFYMVTPATVALKPLRWVTKRLPKSVLWWMTPVLAPMFMLRRVGREMGFTTARHTAYDWFASHEYQYDFTEAQIIDMFLKAGIHPDNVLRIEKGRFMVRKGAFGPTLTDEVHVFGSRA